MEKSRTCGRLSSRHSLVKCESFRCRKIGEKIENNKFGSGSRPWTHVPHPTTVSVSPSFLLQNFKLYTLRDLCTDWSKIRRFLLVRTVRVTFKSIGCKKTTKWVAFFCLSFPSSSISKRILIFRRRWNRNSLSLYWVFFFLLSLPPKTERGAKWLKKDRNSQNKGKSVSWWGGVMLGLEC